MISFSLGAEASWRRAPAQASSAAAIGPSGCWRSTRGGYRPRLC